MWHMYACVYLADRVDEDDDYISLEGLVVCINVSQLFSQKNFTFFCPLFLAPF